MHVSMSDAWDEAQAFVRREAGLLLPLGLATLGLGTLLYELAMPEPKGGTLPPGPWMFALIPVALLVLIGCVSISALVLRPRLSVGEALRLGLARTGSAVLLVVGFSCAFVALIVLFSIVSLLVGTVLGWGTPQVSLLAFGLAMPVLIWLAIRLLPLWAMLADRGEREGPVAIVRQCFALTRGGFWRLLGASILFMAATLLLSSAVQFAFGSVLLLLGRAFGNPELGLVLTAVLMALVGTILQTVWIVYVATIYRRLEASSGM